MDTMAVVPSDQRAAERLESRKALTLRLSVTGAWLTVGSVSLFGDLIHPALRPDSSAAHTTVIVAMWIGYAVVLAALLLAGARALAIARIGVCAGASQLAAAAVSTTAAAGWVAMLAGLFGVVVVLLPAYAQCQLDAASYGDERRFLLRPPAVVLFALVVPLWVVSVAGLAVGPLLLAGSGWKAGIIGAAAGFPAAAFAAHVLHRLGRRWLVFVPNGLVVHDHLAVAEPLPLGRRSIASLGPAPADTTATDLSAQALGMALEIRLVQPAKVAVVTGRGRSEQKSVDALLVSPSRPAAVLATAQRRGLKLE